MNPELELAHAFIRTAPGIAARTVEQGTDSEVAELLSVLDEEDAAAVLSRMVPLSAARALEACPPDVGAKIVRELPLEVAASLVRRVAADARKRLLAAAGEGRRGAAVAELVQHGANTAGALMDPLVLAVSVESTAGQARQRVRSEPESALYYVYVVADQGRLVGVVNQRELMLVDRDEPLASVMTPHPFSLVAHATREAITAHPAWQRVHALPVVDAKGVLLGAIRYETLRRIERELGQGSPRHDAGVTAAALGELYGLGLGGLTEVVASSVRGSRRSGASS
jgi:magnesium transporter